MMTITIGDATPKKPSKPQSAQMDAAAELVRMAREQGLALSACATGGLVVLTPILLEQAKRTPNLARTPPIILAAALLTIAAQIATLPVLITMGTPIGLGSVPANILAMPMVVFITIGGLLSSLSSLVRPELAHGLALVSSWPATWIALLAEFFA